MAEITKSYEPGEVERKWYAAWQQAGAFAGRVDAGKKPYCIVIPPPNVTGVLHIGHVLNNTLQDVLIRRARLEGRSALWIPGTDHASIATHAVVERELRKKEGKSRWQIGREEFLRRTKAWQEKHGGIILEQLKALGCSCDWDRTVFTMDPDYNRAVLTAFAELFQRGHIYRGKRMVNWCPATLTALSDEEVIMKPVNGLLYQVRYELVDRPGEYISVKTTRPETIPGDVAIAVHPEDPRYTSLIGQKVWRPLNRTPIPIVADAAVDKAFGSGALKITPAHDKVDFEIGQRHKLPVIDVLEANGVLNELAGPGLAGLERFAGRKKAAELLRESGALVGEEAYTNNVGYSERADVPIEPRLTWQWWMRYPRIDEAKAAVAGGQIKFYPERWSKVYLHWLNNIQDWCISRQLWWGQRIPVWYRKGLDRDRLTEADLQDPAKVHVSIGGPADPENWQQEDDVLDTWASSWLWPLGTLGWPDEVEQKKRGFDYFYPTETLVTAPEIIFFWVARMIMAGLEFTGKIPFRNVYFTGIVRDTQGRKMSKSLGNSPDPLDLIAKYGADGLRFGIISIAPQGQDIRFQEDRIEAGKNFCNKLWNACRFRRRASEGGAAAAASSLGAIAARFTPAAFDADDHALLASVLATTAQVERCFREFEFSAAVQVLYGFFWNDFCDWYVEVSKAKLQSAATKENCIALQDFAIRQTLLLLHPFSPFITEELWQLLGYGAPGTYLINARTEDAAALTAALGQAGVAIDQAASAKIATLKESFTVLRAKKAEIGLASAPVAVLYYEPRPGYDEFFVNPNYLRMLGSRELRVGQLPDGLAGVSSVTNAATFYIPLPEKDSEAEKARLTAELADLAKHIAATQARLANVAFTAKAPPAVIEGAQRQLAELQKKYDEVRRLLAALG